MCVRFFFVTVIGSVYLSSCGIYDLPHFDMIAITKSNITLVYACLWGLQLMCDVFSNCIAKWNDNLCVLYCCTWRCYLQKKSTRVSVHFCQSFHIHISIWWNLSFKFRITTVKNRSLFDYIHSWWFRKFLLKTFNRNWQSANCEIAIHQHM